MNTINQDDYKLISKAKAASFLSVGKKTLDDLLNTGKIGYIRIGNRKKIPLSELREFLERETTHDEHYGGNSGFNENNEHRKHEENLSSETILQQIIEEQIYG